MIGKFGLLAVCVALLFVLPGTAKATVINFDNLTGYDSIPEG